MKRKYLVREHKGRTQIFTRGAWRYAVERECWHCGYIFYYNPYKKDAGRYCSSECVGKSTQKRYSRLRKRKACAICRKRFEVAPAQAHRYKTCGREYCKQALRRQTGLANWAGRMERERERRVAKRTG